MMFEVAVCVLSFLAGVGLHDVLKRPRKKAPVRIPSHDHVGGYRDVACSTSECTCGGVRDDIIAAALACPQHEHFYRHALERAAEQLLDLRMEPKPYEPGESGAQSALREAYERALMRRMVNATDFSELQRQLGRGRGVAPPRPERPCMPGRSCVRGPGATPCLSCGVARDVMGGE
jgi:hypothetical protein